MKKESKPSGSKHLCADSRLGIVDYDSGEMIDAGQLVYIPKKIRIKEKWFMGMQDGFEKLAKMHIRGESMSVLMLLFSRMDFENFLRIPSGRIGEELNIKKQNVSRALRELKIKGVIVPGPDETWKLSYDFGWKGRVRNLRQEQAKDSKRPSAIVADSAAVISKPSICPTATLDTEQREEFAESESAAATA